MLNNRHMYARRQDDDCQNILISVTGAAQPVSTAHVSVSEFNYSDDSTDTDIQGHFDAFYNAALVLLNRFLS